jgi:hypothetical protein
MAGNLVLKEGILRFKKPGPSKEAQPNPSQKFPSIKARQ